MIRELLDQRADLAIVDLTITYNREQVVDFTMPFMNLGISILYRKPVKQPPNLFSFLSPLSLDVWCYMAVSFVSLFLDEMVADFCSGSVDPTSGGGGRRVVTRASINLKFMFNI